MNSYVLKFCLVLHLVMIVKSQFIQPIPYGYTNKYYSFLSNQDTSHNKIMNATLDMGMLNRPFIFNRIYDKLEDVSAIGHIYKTYLVYEFRELPILRSSINTYFCAKIIGIEKCQRIDASKVPVNKDMFNKVIVENNGTKFMVVFDPQRETDYDRSGFYYIKTVSLHGSFVTNTFEFRDILYWKKKYRNQTTAKQLFYNETMSVSKMPLSFDCLDNRTFKNVPAWVFDIDMEIRWYWCGLRPGISYKYCLENPDDENNFQFAVDVKNLFKTKAFVSNFGQLTLINGDGISTSEIKKYRYEKFFLMCGFESTPIRYVTGSVGELKWLNAISSQNEIIHITNRITTYYVLLNSTGLKIKAWYKTPRSSFKYKWCFNDTKIENFSHLEVDQFSLKFKQNYPITNRDAGVYSLYVTAGKQKEVFATIIKIYRPPMLIKSMPQLFPDQSIYLMDQSSYNLKLTFDFSPVSFKIIINNTEFDLKNESNSTVKSNYKGVNFQYSNFKFNKNLSNITYTLENINASQVKPYGQSHTIEIQSKNQRVTAKTRINFIALQYPKFTKTPSQTDCSVKRCFNSKQPTLIACKYNYHYYWNVGVTTLTEWFLNDTIQIDNKTEYMKYFKYSKDGLLINPIGSDAQKLLENSTITCRVRLLHTYKTKSEEICDTMKLNMASLLTTKLINRQNNNENIEVQPTVHAESTTIKSKMKQMKSATYSWLVFLIIATILVILMIALITKFALSSRHLSMDEPAEERKKLKEDFPSISSIDIHENRSAKSSQADLLPSITVTYHLNKPYAPVLCSDCSNRGSSRLLLSENQSFRSLYPKDLISADCLSLDTKKFDEQASFIGIYSPRSHKTTTTANTNITASSVTNNAQSLIDIVSNDPHESSQRNQNNAYNCHDNNSYTRNWLSSQNHFTAPDPNGSYSFKSIDNTDVV